jgi:ankyrin repeat protein
MKDEQFGVVYTAILDNDDKQIKKLLNHYKDSIEDNDLENWLKIAKDENSARVIQALLEFKNSTSQLSPEEEYVKDTTKINLSEDESMSDIEEIEYDLMEDEEYVFPLPRKQKISHISTYESVPEENLVKVHTAFGYNKLKLALKDERSIKVILEIIEHYPSIRYNREEDTGNTILHYALIYRRFELADIIIEDLNKNGKEYLFNYINNEGETVKDLSPNECHALPISAKSSANLLQCFFNAIEDGSISDENAHLLTHPGLLELKDSKGNNGLHHAVLKNPEAIQLLYDFGVDCTAKNGDSFSIFKDYHLTPLELAIKENNSIAVNNLLQLPNYRSNKQLVKKAFDYALQNYKEDFSCIQIFLIQDLIKSNNSILIDAIEAKKPKLAELLFINKNITSDIKEANFHDWIELHFNEICSKHCMTGHVNTVNKHDKSSLAEIYNTLFCYLGETNPNCLSRITNALGESVLHIALRLDSCCYGLFSNILKFSQNVSSKDKDGNTPLHIALELRDVTAIEALLNKGADIYTKNTKGISPIALATDMPKVKYSEAEDDIKKLMQRQQRTTFIEATHTLVHKNLPDELIFKILDNVPSGGVNMFTAVNRMRSVKYHSNWVKTIEKEREEVLTKTNVIS